MDVVCAAFPIQMVKPADWRAGDRKTALAARLAQCSDGAVVSAKGSAHAGKGFLSAVHFCSARYGSWILPDSFARSPSAKLAMRYTAFAEAIISNPRIHVEQRININRALSPVHGSPTAMLRTLWIACPRHCAKAACPSKPLGKPVGNKCKP